MWLFFLFGQLTW